jgi:DNA modification methylase
MGNWRDDIAWCLNEIVPGDAREVLRSLPDECVQMVVTSPPYWGLRDYGLGESGIGLEKTIEEYVEKLVGVFEEVKRVLRSDGTVWLNMGDTFAANRGYQVRDNKHVDVGNDMSMSVPFGLKAKDLCLIPFRVALALQQAGWYLRSDIIWAKGVSLSEEYVGSVMPESVRDRPTRSHEYLFLLTKEPKYFYDGDAVREKGVWSKGTKAAKGSGEREGNSRKAEYAEYSGTRNMRSVWCVGPKPMKEKHFATFPPRLVEICVRAGTSEYGACGKCGSPWKRVVERVKAPDHRDRGQSYITQLTGERGSRKVLDSDGQMFAYTEKYVVDSTTVGWEPGCKCGVTDVVPCVILDPFIGSGTSGLVARSLNRDFIGIELNIDYVSMAYERIAKGNG